MSMERVTREEWVRVCVLGTVWVVYCNARVFWDPLTLRNAHTSRRSRRDDLLEGGAFGWCSFSRQMWVPFWKSFTCETRSKNQAACMYRTSGFNWLFSWIFFCFSYESMKNDFLNRNKGTTPLNTSCLVVWYPRMPGKTTFWQSNLYSQIHNRRSA